MQIVQCTFSQHAESILAILNDAILHSTALYDYQPRTMETMAAWFAAKEKGRYPIIGVEDDDGAFMGFGSYGAFRAFPAYKYTVEHSIYVDARFRGRGLGKLLLEEVIAAAGRQEYHVIVGVIDSANAASIALHLRRGFVHSGTIRHAGFKFGRWLDVDFYQLTLATPERPIDG